MTIFGVLLGGLLAAGLRAAEPIAFEVQGRIDTRQFLTPDPAGATNSRMFSFATDGRDVFIHYDAGPFDQGVAYNEFGTDGTNGFSMAQTLLRAGATLANDSVMRILPDSLPQRGVAQYLWLIYAARDEFRRRTNSFVRPTTSIWFRERPFDSDLFGILSEHMELRAEWKLDQKLPHLLTSYVDYRDSRLSTEQYSVSLIPDEYMTGKTNSRLEVLSWTNVAELHIPVLAQLTTYLTDTNNPGRLVVYVVHRVTATNVVAGTMRRSFVPKLGRATSVFDYRFMDGPRRPADYLATNGIIFSTAEEAWDEIERRREEEQRRRSLRR